MTLQKPLVSLLRLRLGHITGVDLPSFLRLLRPNSLKFQGGWKVLTPNKKIKTFFCDGVRRVGGKRKVNVFVIL